MENGPAEHADAVAAAREHLDAIGTRPLRPLPEDFESSRVSLHRVAEHLLMPKRVLETGGEIALQFTRRGFGTLPWERGRASGRDGQIRVEGTEVVLVEGGEERRVEVGDLRAEADLVGVESAGIEAGEGIAVDPAAADALADWFAFGTVLLAELIDPRADLDPEPIRIWPEDFDVATALGHEETGSRAIYGASSGDDRHPQPYLYVAPRQRQPSGELWTATGFVGAELGYEALRGSIDQLGAGLEFFLDRLEALTTG